MAYESLHFWFIKRKWLPCILAFPLSSGERQLRWWRQHPSAVVLKVYFADTRRFPRTFQGVWEVIIIFIIIVRCYFPVFFFFLFCTWINGINATMCRTAGALAWIKAVTPNCPKTNYILHSLALAMKQNKTKCQFQLRVSFKKHYKYLIKSSLLGSCVKYSV